MFFAKLCKRLPFSPPRADAPSSAATPTPGAPALPATVPGAARALPGFDTAIGLAYVQRNEALYRKLLVLFRDTQVRCFDAAFRQAQDDRDPDAVVRLAHSLKGSAKLLGALGLAGIAAELEAGAAATDADRAAQLQAAAGAELAGLLPGLAGLH